MSGLHSSVMRTIPDSRFSRRFQRAGSRPVFEFCPSREPGGIRESRQRSEVLEVFARSKGALPAHGMTK